MMVSSTYTSILPLVVVIAIFVGAHGHQMSSHMSCHHHEHQTVLDEGEVSLPLACAAPQVNIRSVNNPVYGSLSKEQCSEMCSTEAAIQFLTGDFEVGSCVDIGYANAPIEKSVPLEGSPLHVTVVVAEYAPPYTKTCHCHNGHVEISCDEDDEKYVKFVEEKLREGCAGIIAGSKDKDEDGNVNICPTDCMEAYEVLHLHYIECSARPIHEDFLKVEAAGICHEDIHPPESGKPCTIVNIDYARATTNSSSSRAASFNFSYIAAGIMFVILAATLYT